MPWGLSDDLPIAIIIAVARVCGVVMLARLATDQKMPAWERVLILGIGVVLFLPIGMTGKLYR